MSGIQQNNERARNANGVGGARQARIDSARLERSSRHRVLVRVHHDERGGQGVGLVEYVGSYVFTADAGYYLGCKVWSAVPLASVNQIQVKDALPARYAPLSVS